MIHLSKEAVHLSRFRVCKHGVFAHVLHFSTCKTEVLQELCNSKYNRELRILGSNDNEISSTDGVENFAYYGTGKRQRTTTTPLKLAIRRPGSSKCLVSTGSMTVFAHSPCINPWRTHCWMSSSSF